MKRTRRFVLLVIILLMPPLPSSQASSPYNYHTYLVAVIEAYVTNIRLVEVPAMPTCVPSPAGGGRDRMEWVQKISLKILKVEKMELNRTGSDIYPGDIIEVTNQFLDQKPPFSPGETIRVRVRLVLPEERYHPQDPRQQWWFFPPGEAESFHPRRPFIGIQAVR